MSARVAVVVVVVVVAFVAGALGGCVFPDTTIGETCSSSSDCAADRVCLPEDVQVTTSPTVCLPMPEVDAPVSCTTGAECVVAGFPVDATCGDDAGDFPTQCVCDPAAATFTCSDAFSIDETTCLCSQ